MSLRAIKIRTKRMKFYEVVFHIYSNDIQLLENKICLTDNCSMLLKCYWNSQNKHLSISVNTIVANNKISLGQSLLEQTDRKTGNEVVGEGQEKNKEHNKDISAEADGGPCSLVCARLTLRSSPHWHQRKCLGAHVLECMR